MGHPAFLYDQALRAYLGSGSRDHTRPIRLPVAAGDERISTGLMTSGSIYTSLRSLLPPDARSELQSSRLAEISTLLPMA